MRVKGKHKPIRIYTPLAQQLAQQPETSNQQIDEAVAAALQSRQAFDHYMKQEWQQAIALYQQLPHERLRALYLQRCKDYQRELPEAGWDGAFTMTSK